MRKTFFHSISENLILERIDGIGKTNAKPFKIFIVLSWKTIRNLKSSVLNSVIYFDPFWNAENAGGIDSLSHRMVALIQCHTEHIILRPTGPVRVHNSHMICVFNI